MPALRLSLKPALLALVCLLLSVPLLLAGCGGENPATENTLTAVIPDGEGSIAVKAALTDAFLDSYLEKKVYLFELPSSCGGEEVDLSDLTPVAEARPKADMTLKVPASEGTRSRLYSSFLLASYDSESRTYTPITGLLAVTDFSSLAASSKGNDVQASIKGLISDHPADAIRLGISHTILDVPMEKLILKAWQEGALSYVYNGVTRYLDAAELDKLDGLVRAYADGGVKVYLRFVLGDPSENPSVPSCLYAPAQTENEASLDKTYAVNMDDPAAAEIMEGFFGFMADRYASPEEGDPCAASFILGYRVNDTALHNVGGSAESYEKLVRVAYTALRSHNAAGQVYLSLNDLRLASKEEALQDIPAFLKEFSEACALRGDFDWHVSCDLYTDSNAIWEKDTETDDRFYTVHSLRSLTDLLHTEAYLTPSGEARRLMISGFTVTACSFMETPTAEDYTKQAASYAFAYLTCVENGGVEALIYSRHADYVLESDHVYRLYNGIWGRDGEGMIATPRTLYGIFKKIDTTAFPALTGGLAAIVDTPYTRLEQALTGTEPPVTLVEGTASLESFSPTHPKATPLFTFDGGSTGGFAGASALTYMELSRVEVPDTVILYSRFHRESACDPMAITVTVSAAELAEMDRLTVDLYAGAVKTETATEAKPSVTLRMTRAAGSDRGAVIYEATAAEVSGGLWQSAVFDIRDFVSLLDGSDEITLTLSMDYDPAAPSPSANHMGIAGIYVSAEEPAGGTLSGGVIAAIAIGGAVVVLGVAAVLILKSKCRR